MFKRLFKKLVGEFREPSGNLDSSTQPNSFSELADQTPVNPGGANFQIHKLIEVNSERLEFRATIEAKIIYLIFLFAGLAVLIGVSVQRISSGDFALNLGTIFPVIFGLVFAGIGGGMFYCGTAPIVFDKQKRAFWKGRKTPDDVFNQNEIKHFAELEEVRALQIISEYCDADDGGYTSYELNLVLESGKRVNVVDHGNHEIIRKDAETLSVFLEKPVWDSTLQTVGVRI